MAELTLREHLARHLRFLKASCDAFDQGDRDEAIRIAVSLRVLMHTGGGSPLLAQLGSPEPLLLSTCPEIHEDSIWYVGGLSSTRINITDGVSTASNAPLLDLHPHFHRFLPWGDWWSQVVCVTGNKRLTRSDIATIAANKEGAHIAPRLPAEYKALQDGLVTVDHFSDGQTVSSVRLEDVHYTDLRQMAYEILSSPDLTR